VADQVAKADDPTCVKAEEECDKGFSRGIFKEHSLLQLKTPVVRGSEAFASQQIANAAAAVAAAADSGEIIGRSGSDALEEDEGPEILPPSRRDRGVRGSHFETPEAASAAMRTEVVKLLSNAAENSNAAQLTLSEDATKAAQTAQAFEDAHRSSQKAQMAQSAEAKKSDEAGQALVGAMQRVEKAEEVEGQELAMEAVATRRLQDAARQAMQVQMLEDEAAAREARAAQMLQEALRKIGNAENEDAQNPHGDAQDLVRETLRVVEETQKAVAAEASNKVRASQLLQTSLQGAASAVETLQRDKEAQTNKWLHDALGGLQNIQASWMERKQAQNQVAQQLDNAVKNSESAEKLAEQASESKQSTATMMQDVVQKVRTAQSVATEEASVASLIQNEAQNREAQMKETLRQLEGQRQLQEGPMQTTRVGQLENYVQGMMQNVRAANEVQQMQLNQVLQQLNQQAAPAVPQMPRMQMTPQAMPPAQQAYVQVASQAVPQNNLGQEVPGSSGPLAFR
jgi:hypothetical protein